MSAGPLPRLSASRPQVQARVAVAAACHFAVVAPAPVARQWVPADVGASAAFRPAVPSPGRFEIRPQVPAEIAARAACQPAVPALHLRLPLSGAACAVRCPEVPAVLAPRRYATHLRLPLSGMAFLARRPAIPAPGRSMPRARVPADAAARAGCRFAVPASRLSSARPQVSASVAAGATCCPVSRRFVTCPGVSAGVAASKVCCNAVPGPGRSATRQRVSTSVAARTVCQLAASVACPGCAADPAPRGCIARSSGGVARLAHPHANPADGLLMPVHGGEELAPFLRRVSTGFGMPSARRVRGHSHSSAMSVSAACRSLAGPKDRPESGKSADSPCQDVPASQSSRGAAGQPLQAAGIESLIPWRSAEHGPSTFGRNSRPSGAIRVARPAGPPAFACRSRLRRHGGDGPAGPSPKALLAGRPSAPVRALAAEAA